VNPPQTPLQLESFFVEALTYRAREGFDLRQVPLERVDVNVNSLQHKDSPNRLMVRLEVKIGQQESSNARCELDLRLVGFFVLPEGLDAGLKAAMHSQNAPSILYGVARQIVAETTGNGPWGKVFLPTMNFVAAAGGKAGTAQPAPKEQDAPVVSDKPSARPSRRSDRV
jgi:preprotein translocase subunit SecB